MWKWSSIETRNRVGFIGHAGHPEVEGTMGRPVMVSYLVETLEDVQRLRVNNPDDLAYVTQTTLSVTIPRELLDALRARFPAIPRAAERRHLLRHADRQERGKGAGAGVRCGLVVGFAE